MNRRFFLPLQRENSAFGDGLPQNGVSSDNMPKFAQRTTAGLQPYIPSKDNPWDYAKAAHLLRRCIIGVTDKEIRQAVTDGLDATMSKIFTSYSPDTSEIADFVVQDVRVKPAAGQDPKDFQQQINANRQKLARWWMKTISNARLSLQEKMTVFWHGHFTSESSKVNFAEFMLLQNQTYRRDMLGDFKQFVKDVTVDPAMLIYLDNAKNYKTTKSDQINENYARELMELFTCGPFDWDENPNYTQSDVHEGARALSGWTIAPSAKGSEFLGTSGLFVESRWDSGSKTFLGKIGQFKAFDVVDIIFEQRGDQVSKFICEKLYHEFVYYLTDRDIVAQMAQTLRQNNWSIRTVLEELLRSQHFFDAANIGAKQRSPVEYLLGMIRSFGITTVPDFNFSVLNRFSTDLSNRMNALGQLLFEPPDVKGWRAGRTWVSTSTLPPRQKFVMDIIDGILKMQKDQMYIFDVLAFAKSFPTPNTAKKLCADMSQFLLNIVPSDKEAKMLLDTMTDGAPDYEWNINDAQYATPRLRKFMKAAIQLAKYQLA